MTNIFDTSKESAEVATEVLSDLMRVTRVHDGKVFVDTDFLKSTIAAVGLKVFLGGDAALVTAHMLLKVVDDLVEARQSGNI